MKLKILCIAGVIIGIVMAITGVVLASQSKIIGRKVSAEIGEYVFENWDDVQFSLKLEDGGKYSMSEDGAEFSSGTYRLYGNKITLAGSLGEAYEGTMKNGGVITVSIGSVEFTFGKKANENQMTPEQRDMMYALVGFLMAIGTSMVILCALGYSYLKDHVRDKFK